MTSIASATGPATTPVSTSCPAASAPLSPAGLAAGYRQYFEIVPATNDRLKRHNYRIRHEVYCRELGFEPHQADGIECDAHDGHSIHYLVRAVASQNFVGCARLILQDPDDPAALLPFEQTCGDRLDRSIVDPARLDRSKIAEVSRLAIVSQYRRRQGEGGSPVSVGDVGIDGARVRLPYLTLGLYLALIALARWQRLEKLFILTEPSLARSLKRLGVDLYPMGASVLHRGERTPYVMDVAGIVAGLNPPVRELFDTITREIDQTVRTSS